MKRNLYKEWKEIEHDNYIIDTILSRYTNYDKYDIESVRCDDGNIYYYNDLFIRNISKYYPILPNNFVVYGNVNINNIKLKKLPNGFVVHGSLFCAKNKLKEIPPDLIVYGEFNCSHNIISEIPTTIKISENLFCDDNKLKFIPNNLDVGGDIFCTDNNFKITKTTHGHNIYVNEEYQNMQNRLMKINKLKCV